MNLTKELKNKSLCATIGTVKHCWKSYGPTEESFWQLKGKISFLFPFWTSVKVALCITIPNHYLIGNTQSLTHWLPRFYFHFQSFHQKNVWEMAIRVICSAWGLITLFGSFLKILCYIQWQKIDVGLFQVCSCNFVQIKLIRNYAS